MSLSGDQLSDGTEYVVSADEDLGTWRIKHTGVGDLFQGGGTDGSYLCVREIFDEPPHGPGHVRVPCCCCCCWYFPPVREVCPDYEVVGFHPWTLTTPDLGCVTYRYEHLLTRPTLSSWLPMSRLPRHLLLPASTQDHPLTRASPLSVPEYRDNSVPSPLSPTITRVRLLRPPLSITTPAKFRWSSIIG